MLAIAGSYVCSCFVILTYTDETIVYCDESPPAYYEVCSHLAPEPLVQAPTLCDESITISNEADVNTPHNQPIILSQPVTSPVVRVRTLQQN